MKKQILIIDDDTSAACLLKLSLERTGAYEVRTENSGASGLAATKEFKPDLFLLDVDMPEMDGGEVACRIQADKNLKDIPIVFLTSMVSEQEAGDEGALIGGFPFMAKPVNVKRLVERIERILGKQREVQQPTEA